MKNDLNNQKIHVDLGELQGPARGLVVGIVISGATLVLCALGTWALVALGVI